MLFSRGSGRLGLVVFGVLAAALPLTGCGGGGDGGTNPPPTPTVATVGVSVAAASITVGQTTTATAVARDAQGTTIGGKTPTWSSSTPTVASVDASGTVTGLAAGSAEIVATIDGRTGQAAITVTPAPVASVTVTLSATSINVGQSTQASAVLRDAAGNTLSGRAVNWTSSSAAVATVSTSGLVSGVGAGTASITATSEGRTGQASVTVTVAATLTGLQLVGPGGAPLDATNVAGTIRVRYEATVPTGWRGVREIKVGGRLFRSDSVVGTSGALARLVPEESLVDVSSSVASITAGDLQQTGLRNGSHLLQLTQTVTPPGGQPQSITVTQTVTLRQNNALFLYIQPQRTTTIDGARVHSGDVKARIGFTSFTGEALEKVEILTAPAQAQYGAAPAGAISLITRSGSDLFKEFTISGAAMGFESPTQGTRDLVKFTIGAVDRSPWLQGYSEGGNAASVDGTGLSHGSRTLTGITLQPGITFQYTPQPDNIASVLPGFTAYNTAETFDNVAPRAGPASFTPWQRETRVGQRAWSATGVIGISDNYLGKDTRLSDWLTLADFTDRHLDLSAPVAYYASRTRATLFDQASAIVDASAIPAASSKDWYIGASFTDRPGNRGYYVAQTNTANPFGVGTEARFGKLTVSPTLGIGGLANGSVINASGMSASVTNRATGSLFPANPFYAVAYAYGKPTSCFIGFGLQCDLPEVRGGTLSQNGAQADFAFTVQDLVNRRTAAEGGSGDGPVTGYYWAADHGGNWATGGYTSMTPLNVFVDRSPPTATATVTFPMSDQVSVTVRATDGIAVESGEIGGGFAWSNSLFLNGELWLPFARFDLGGNLTTGLTTDVSRTFNAPFLTTGRFFDFNTGLLTSTAFKSNKAYFASYDYARNVTRAFTPITNNAPIEAAPASIQRVMYSVGGSSVCGGPVCAGGVPTSLHMQVDAYSPNATTPLEKVSFLGLPSDKLVRLMGFDVTPSVTTVTGGYRFRYELDFSPKDLCWPTGAYYGKVGAITADGKQALFPNAFPLFTIVPPTSGSNACQMPARDLGWSTSWAPPPPPQRVPR